MTKVLIRIREWIKFNLFRPLLLHAGRHLARFAEVPDVPVFEPGTFDWTRKLEENWTVICEEFKNLGQYERYLPAIQDIQQEQKVLNSDQQWKTFFLYGFGQKARQNCSLCPQTTALLESIPGMKTAFFSVIAPGKHIPAHKGLFKGVIRSHLGLIIPGAPGSCRMRIADQMYHWEPGAVIVFDDTYEHEVWNEAESPRVVLLLDVIRPFRAPFSWLNRRILALITGSSYVREAKKRHQLWEAEFHRNLHAATN